MDERLNPYARWLGAGDPLLVIQQMPGRLEEIARRLTPERAEWRRAPGKWNAREILCHLADSEIAFGFRLRQALAEPHHVIQPFDQERWARAYDGYTVRTAVDTFVALRQWNLAFIASADPGDMARPVLHPERGEMTFRTIVETMAGHDLNHLSQLDGILAG